MIFDFKKENKELYHPKNSPQIIKVPPMKFLAVEGRGDPNKEEGDYNKVLMSLYAVGYTLKMSCKGNHRIQGFKDSLSMWFRLWRGFKELILITRLPSAGSLC
ncbi:hypothetical protein [Proteiniclasticum ruminis]|uniref:hypothetical protein n=1 Tax=Proteiniclasticum ruminis TaxID=398199 RepID=UPI0028AD3134|nr:hypothetical protein [Proteiniclasticum ruminis]